MGVGKAVPHRRPVIEPVIERAGPRLFPVVTRVERRIEGRDRPFHRPPFPLTVLVLGSAGLQAAFISVRAGVADVLFAVGLGKEQAEANAAGKFGMRRIKAFHTRNRSAQIDDVPKRRIRALRVGGRRLQDVEQRAVFIDQRLAVGVEVRRRIPNLLALPILPGTASVRSL